MAKPIVTSSIEIDKIIVHDIPKHRKGDTELVPNYSQQESNLSETLKKFFKDKVVQSLNSDKSFRICFSEENESTVPWITKELIKNNGQDFVEKSKSIAKQLFDIQVGNNAAGILVVIFGQVSEQNTCIILKLEKDMGAQLTLDPKTKSYNIQEVQDLMLTQKTKIFKVALIIDREIFKTKYDGVIMDYQIDIREKKYVTTWFIDKFLGCRAFEDPKITTQKFFNHTRTYINTLEDELTRAKYIQDLNSYVKKNSGTLSAKEFADDYFVATEHKNDYTNFLKTKNFTLSSFPKDTSQIEKFVKKITLTFTNDITIIGNKGTFNDKVKLEKLENGETKAEIVSKIKKVE